MKVESKAGSAVMGHVDLVNPRKVSGWAALADKSEESVTVGLFIDDILVMKTPADIERPDLKKLGFASVRHGFSFNLATSGICSTQLVSMRVKILGTEEFLRGVRYVPTDLERAHISGEFHSRFGGSWIDRVDGTTLLEKRFRKGDLSEADYAKLKHFKENGYVILQGTVDTAVVDRVNRDIDQIWSGHLKGVKVETFMEGGIRKYLDADMKYRDGVTKLLDIYTVSQSAREAILSKPITRFLSLLFEADPWGFQSLSFWNGSQQQIHKDSAYVRIHPPMSMAASWIALEDVVEGTGELQYYERSHLSPDYLFGGVNKWADGHREQHPDFLDSLHRDAKKYGQPLRSFLPKKGDVLIWHADLAHGGAKITKPGMTRKSLVTHYCSEHAYPHYFMEGATQKARLDGGYLSSQYGKVK